MPSESEGLSDEAVRARIAHGDVNTVPAPTSRTTLEIVRTNVFTRFNALLGTLCALVLMSGHWQDAMFGGVLVINALIGIVQELRAKWALDNLTLISQPKACAIREGRAIRIPAEEIVLDDVLELVPGDQVLVDGLVLTHAGLEMDESLLTGESEAMPKLPGEAVLSGSFVVAGTGRYRVTRIGASTYAHTMVQEAKRFKLAHSELRAGINRILQYITWALMPTAALLFVSQLAAQAPIPDVLLFSAAGVVAMVPEGLVLLTSLALAVGAIRLAQRRILVQDLPATETLARIDVLCLDKTGTLTEREPMVERVEPLGDHPGALDALSALAASDPAPNATLQAIQQAFPGGRCDGTTQLIPFSSARKWSGATLSDATWVLGAPDVLLANLAEHRVLLERADELARTGLRVLLLARTENELTPERVPLHVNPASFVLLSERIRVDAAETLRYFAEQGVTIKVISGDHACTVSQTAAKLGIQGASEPVDAYELATDPSALSQRAESHAVFGRVSPQQKKEIVASLKAHGHVVAMVGDGVNDILAIQEADIGIALGCGAGATRSVSQLVLLDNQFAMLPSVITEGRRVIGNVERLAALFLTKTVYAMLLALAVGVADVTFPFLPRHLTLVGALTIGIPAFVLSLERNAERARPGFIKRVLRFAVPSGLFAAGATFAAYATATTYLGSTMAEARTAATVVLIFVTLWILALVARPLTHPRKWLVAGMATAFLVVLGTPALKSFFALENLPLRSWLALILIATAAIGVLHWSSMVSEHLPSVERNQRPLRKRVIAAWLHNLGRSKWLLVTAVALVIGGLWLFGGVMEDVISRDPLIVVDTFVYHFLQSVHTPVMDRLMLALTELGGPRVLLSVILVALAWFLAHRFWLTAGYWVATVGIAEVMVKVVKLSMHRPRPTVYLGGVEQFSFPSGHATMSVVIYGFLAFLLCRKASPGLRKGVLASVTLVILLIAFSRVYLGAHWLSDVLGGFGLGTAWIAALSIAYAYQSHEQLRPRRFAAVMLVTMLLAEASHFVIAHGTTRSPEAPRTMASPTGSP